MHTILKIFYLAVVAGLCMSGSCDNASAAVNGSTYTLAQPSSQIPIPAGMLSGDWNLGQWQNGLMVLRAAGGPLTNKEVTNLVAVERSGKITLQTAVWVPDAASVQTMGSAVSPEHLVAVCGYADSPSAGITGFVQEIRPDGSVLRTILTGNFSAVNLAYDAKGNLWVAGSPRAEGNSYPQHNILRKYRDGVLQADFLPYMDFLPKYEATTRVKTHPARHGTDGRTFLLPLSDGMGLWCPGTHEWIEIGPDGAVLGRWQVPLPKPTIAQPPSEPAAYLPPTLKLYGLAVTSSGEVIASITERDVGTGFYRLDKASSSWQEISLPSDAPTPVGYVAGADGDNVVYRYDSGWALSGLVKQ